MGHGVFDAASEFSGLWQRLKRSSDSFKACLEGSQGERSFKRPFKALGFREDFGLRFRA